jgi:transcriptional accessory protein Tex/SPT6
VAFGAVADMGVHLNGRLHVLPLADRFVKDRSEVGDGGGRVKVRVVRVEAGRGGVAWG